jgi:hypothetical protein
MNWKKLTPITLLFMLLLAACANAGRSEEATAPQAAPGQPPVVGRAADGDFAFAVEAAAEPSAANSVQGLPQERLIIRTADLSVVVPDTDEAMATITQMVEANGGWIVSSNVYQYSDNAKTGSLTARVPTEGFNSAIDAIKGLAVRVTNESRAGQDVTEEYVDLGARLGNLEATAERVRAFLDEADDVEGALAVNQELSRLEGEIEVIKGRMQYLSQSASFSTITVNLTPDALSQPLTVGGWEPQGIAREAIKALVSTLQGVAAFLIWALIYPLPLALLFGIPLWLVVRFVRRRRRRPNIAPTQS